MKKLISTLMAVVLLAPPTPVPAQEAANAPDQEELMRQLLEQAMSNTNDTGEIVALPKTTPDVPADEGGMPVPEPVAEASEELLPLPVIPIIPDPLPSSPDAAGSGLADAPVLMPVDDDGQPDLYNFPAMPFDQALDEFARLTGRVILRQSVVPNAPEEIYLVGELTPTEAIEAFSAVFAMNGIALLPVGTKFLRVVPTNQAGQAGQPFDNRSATLMTETGQFVRQVVSVTNADVAEVAQILAPFASPQAGNTAVTALESNQMLILQDYAANVKRMRELIEKIDVTVPLNVELELIPIKYALSTDIGEVIGSLTPNGAVSVSGSSRSARSTSSRSSRTSSSRSSTQNRTGATPATSASANRTGFQSRLRNIVNRAAAGDIQVLGDAKIIPDERSNSLLVFANKQDMKMIKEIISKLDVVQAQVLLETVIMEVGIGDSFDMGISYFQNPQKWGDVTTAGWLNNATSDNPFLNPGNINSTNSVFAGGFNYLANINGDLNIVLQAIATDREVHILQKPRIQTFHAEEAHLFVGENRPFVNSTFYNSASISGQSSSSVTRERIGVELNILPLINPDGLVVLEIDQIIENVSDEVLIGGNLVPVTTEREASAAVAVRDGQTIILGGFISDTTRESNSGIPFLKDIPGLGKLFQTQSDENQRAELIILIRPTVMETPEIAMEKAQEELEEMVGVRHAVQKMEFQSEEREEKLRRQIERRSKKSDK